MGTPLLRFNGAVARDPAVEAWFDATPGDLPALATTWFAVMRQCGDEVRELLHDGCPVACLGDVPFAYVNVYSRHVNVEFFQGAALPDPAGLLETAVNGRADWLVTFNRRHVEAVSTRFGIAVASPAETVRRLGETL